MDCSVTSAKSSTAKRPTVDPQMMRRRSRASSARSLRSRPTTPEQPAPSYDRYRRRSRSVAEAVDDLCSSLPVALDTNDQVEVGTLGQLRASGGSRSLQHRAAVSDHDAFLRVALDEDLYADIGPLPLDDATRDGVRELFSRNSEQLFTNELRDELRVWRVTNDIRAIKARADRQPTHEIRHECLDTLPGTSRDREELRVIEAELVLCVLQLFEDRLLVDRVELVHDDDGVLRQACRDEAIAWTDRGRRLDDQDVDVDVGDRRGGGLIQPSAELGARAVHAGRIDEDDLEVLTVQHAANRGPRGVRIPRRDGDLLAENLIQQRGLADVRPTDDRDEPRANLGLGDLTHLVARVLVLRSGVVA